MNISEFRLKDPKEITQEQLENWYNVISEVSGGESIADMNMSRYRRITVQSSIDAGWFEKLPKGFKSSDVAQMKPGNVQAIAKLIDSFYNEIVEPDADFISAPPTA